MDKTQLFEKPPVILEIGSLFTRIGTSDESIPQKIIYTPQNIRIWLLTKDNPNKKNKSLLELEHDMEAFILQVFIYELLLNPKDRMIIFCEDTFMPREFVEAFAKVALKRFNIPKIYFFYNMMLPMYTTSSFTGIVVNCGYQDIQILPIYEGYPLKEGFVHLPAGGKKISRKLKECLLNQNLGLQEDVLSEYILEDIKVKYLNLLLKNQKEDYFSSEKNIQKMKDKLYTIEIEKKKIKISYYDKVSILESIFGDPDNEEINIAASVLDSISKVNVHSKKKVVQCVVVCGGLTMIPNFGKRLRQELDSFFKSKKYSNISALSDSFSFIDEKYPLHCLTWIGASVLSNLNGIERFAVGVDSNGNVEVPDKFGESFLYSDLNRKNS